MSNKSLTIRRIVIFCALAFLPLIIVTPLLNMYYGEFIFVSEKAAVGSYVFGLLGMMSPAAANLLTRLITKEGMKNSFLALDLKGKGRYYAASVLTVLAEGLLGIILFCVFFMNGMSLTEIFPAEGLSDKSATILFQISYSVVVFFPAFGEEFGWRGYLMPKLCKVMSKPAAVVVGGVIWGLWHAPLTISGHNFGVDYPLYPWLGILMMCIICVAENAFLTLLTERTGSVFPASFYHMVNNNCAIPTIIGIFGSEAAISTANNIPSIQAALMILFIPLAVVGTVSFILILRKGRAHERSI